MNSSLKERLKKYWLYRNLANIITVCGGITAAIGLIMILVCPERIIEILIMFSIATVSDFVDGKIARWLEIQSRWGDFVDRIRDKILVSGCVILVPWFLLYRENIPYLVKAEMVIIFIIEAVLTFFALYGKSKGLRIRANDWGKYKMGFESITMLVWLLLTVIDRFQYVKKLGSNLKLMEPYGFYLVEFGFAVGIFLALISLWCYYSEYFPEIKQFFIIKRLDKLYATLKSYLF